MHAWYPCMLGTHACLVPMHACTPLLGECVPMPHTPIFMTRPSIYDSPIQAHTNPSAVQLPNGSMVMAFNAGCCDPGCGAVCCVMCAVYCVLWVMCAACYVCAVCGHGLQRGAASLNPWKNKSLTSMPKKNKKTSTTVQQCISLCAPTHPTYPTSLTRHLTPPTPPHPHAV